MKTKRTCALLAVMATLLLSGCRSGCEEDGITRPEKSSLGRVIDSPAELPLAPSRGGMGTPSQRVIDSPALTGTPSQRGKDSLKEYYERMMRWRVLHGGMSRWESDK
jgi:hypothetical protein